MTDVDYPGSAEYYLGEDDLTSKYLFAYMFARNCTGRKFCYEIPSKGDISIPLDDIVLFVERMYNDPVTHIGADESELINPYITHYAPVNTKVIL